MEKDLAVDRAGRGGAGRRVGCRWCCTGSKSTELYFENREKEKWVKKFKEASFVQSVRYLNYANYLTSTRGSGKDSFKALVKKIRRAGECWLFGLRALYFALIVLLWFFGPVPMFLTSFILVIILYIHDTDTKDLDNVEDDQQANA
ncbi:hypothetical protein SO802_006287 [Lithocarpus litseifolius]|uniref:PRA1 family protein n=1 Tax=Lithocarpus litseifolius TaxID=425828 RepID=A0AAW2DM28_9ROSI